MRQPVPPEGTLDGIAATLGTPGGGRELQARLDGTFVSEQAQVNNLLEEAAATVDPWALLDQIEKGVPLKEGEQLPRARLGLYDQAMAAITNERHAATREMLCKRASQVFEGVPLARIRADVQRLLPASANDKKVVVTDPEPWPDPIENGAMLLDEIERTFVRYMVLPNHAASALALWTVFTHALDAFDVAPILAIQSPVRRCGKTRLLKILARLVRRAVTGSNITSASLYRTVDRFQPTLIVDEAETWLAEDEQLRGVINSGHERDLAFVIRCEGDEHEPRRFSTWGGRALALIGTLSALKLDTVEDRSVVLTLSRRRKDERVAKLPRERLVELETTLRRKIFRWVSDHGTLATVDAPVLDELDDRAQDNWGPLLVIAQVAGGDWPARARAAALALSAGDARADESAGSQLLADIRRYFGGDNEREAVVFTETLIKWLTADDERPWATWSHGKPITPKQLGRLLSPFGIRSGNVRMDNAQAKRYKRADLEDVFVRYLPQVLPSHPSPTNDDADLAHNFHPSQDPAGTDAKCDVSARKENLGTDGTAKQPVPVRKPVS